MTTSEPPEGRPYYAGSTGEPPLFPVEGQQPAYPPPYPPQQHHYPYPPPQYVVVRPTNGMAIASMVLGILWLYWIGSVLALIFGYVARKEIQRTGAGGDGMAIAGIVLGWVGVGILCVVLIVVGVAAWT